MKKILVTGGAGFLGKHLVKELLKDKKNEVTVIDILLSSKNYNPPQNVIFFCARPADILRFDTKTYDEIYHLASPASPKIYQKHSLLTIESNTLDLEWCLKRGKKVLFTSTSEIYGDPLEHPQKEEYRGNVNTIGPRSCYDESKRLGETYCYEYKNGKIVRIFNTYGPGMNLEDGRVIINFIVQALKEEPLTVYGDGSQTRSFCYVDDTISGLMLVMEKGKFVYPYNIGNEKEITIKELAEKIIKLTESKSEIVYESLPKDDPTRRKPICTRANNLGWSASTSINSGIKKMIKSVKDKL